MVDIITLDRRQLKTLIQLMKVDQNRESLIAICRQSLFLAIFDPRSLIVKSVFDFRLSGVMMMAYILNSKRNAYFQYPFNTRNPYQILP